METIETKNKGNNKNIDFNELNKSISQKNDILNRNKVVLKDETTNK